MIAQSCISPREYHRVHGTLAMVNIWAELLCMVTGGQWNMYDVSNYYREHLGSLSVVARWHRGNRALGAFSLLNKSI